MSVVLSNLAHMECAARGCLNTLDIDLCLTVTGGFAARPPLNHGWQVDHVGVVFVCRCPEHHTKILRMPNMGEVNGDTKS
jgi:hypothetical protein